MTTDSPVTFGLRKRGEAAIIGVIPAKVHAIPAKCPDFLRDYEEVPLYTTPPATIPVAGLEALVEELRLDAAGFSDGDASARRAIANRIAQLIQEAK